MVHTVDLICIACSLSIRPLAQDVGLDALHNGTMLAWNEHSLNIRRPEAVPLELSGHAVRRIHVRIERKGKVTCVHTVVFDRLAFREVSSFCFTDAWDVEGSAIRKLGQGLDKLHGEQ